MKLSAEEILKVLPAGKRQRHINFLHELNRREYEVRFKKSCTFDEFRTKPKHDEEFGTGFSVYGKSVPYFHPNRSFHDEIIWLDRYVYYNDECTFDDMLLNAAIVKFYGPSNTIEIITRNTGKGFIQFDKLINDEEYVLHCMNNIHEAITNKEKLYGTTELRTSLQTESRNYTRQITTPYDIQRGVTFDPTRKGRGSDMLYWFKELGPKMSEFYRTKPTMEESFNFLTSFRGIGNYYGYHFSTNLARMPLIGSHHLLKPGAPSGNLNEDDTFVAPGVGAMITINWYLEHLGFSINSHVGAKIIRAIRADQDNYFDFKGESKMVVEEVFETGALTTFGVEIGCCQFGIFNRLRFNTKLAKKRSDAPISKEGINEPNIGDDCVIHKKPKKMTTNSDFIPMEVEILKFEELKRATTKQEVIVFVKKVEKTNVVEKIKATKKIDVEVGIEVGIKKPKKASISYIPNNDQLEIIQKIIANLNTNKFPHKVIVNLIDKDQLKKYFNQDTNWKDTWKTLQYLIYKGLLIKENRLYVINESK
jgi:hypothetical protein